MHHRFAALARTLTLLVVASLAGARGAYGQAAPDRGAIEGTALDSATGAPKPGVAVTLEGTGRGMLTDATGQFAICHGTI